MECDGEKETSQNALVSLKYIGSNWAMGSSAEGNNDRYNGERASMGASKAADLRIKNWVLFCLGFVLKPAPGPP